MPKFYCELTVTLYDPGAISALTVEGTDPKDAAKRAWRHIAWACEQTYHFKGIPYEFDVTDESGATTRVSVGGFERSPGLPHSAGKMLIGIGNRL